MRVCQHCGMVLTAEWDDELCVCGKEVPRHEVPRRIQLGPSQQKRGMGKLYDTDRERQRERRAKMSDAEKKAQAQKRSERRRAQVSRRNAGT